MSAPVVASARRAAARAAPVRPLPNVVPLPRVVIVTRDDPEQSTGGVETFCRLLLRALPGSEVVAYSGAAGRRLICNEARDARAILPRLEAKVEELRPDAVIANGAAAWAITRKLARRLRVPVIPVYHGTYAGFGRAIASVAPLRALVARTYGAFLERRAGERRPEIVAVSARVAAEADALYGRRATVVENCASLAGTRRTSKRAKAKARAALELAADARVVLFVGRAERTKGFDLVTELARRRRDVVVLAAGVAPSASLPENLRALGTLAADLLAAAYAAADVVVLPSLYEGCPFALLDALHADRPIVTTATGCFERPGRHPFGIVLATAESEPFVAAVDEVVGRPERFTPRAAVGERFSFHRFAREWRTLIDEVAGRCKPPARAARPRRIALLEPAGRGGICHATRGLAEALARRGDEVALFTARDFEFETADLPFRVERLFDRWRTSLRRVVAALRRFQPDLVHLQSGTHPALHLGLLLVSRAATRAPVVVTAHDVVPKNASWSDAPFCRALYRAADRIVVHGAAPAAELARRFPAAARKLDVVPHGEYGFLAPDRKRQQPRANGPPTLLFFGYLHEEKGLPDLIDALPAVVKELPELRVVVAGTPELDVAPLVARARAAGVESRIDWRLRYVPADEVADLFTAATAVVLPYRAASQSGVAFLAGAYERPVVATRVGALPELIEDGRGGALVHGRDPAGLAAGILRVVREPAIARRMGEEHGRRCRAVGSWDAIAEKTAAAYDATIAEASRGGEGAPLAPRPRTRSRTALPFVTVVVPARNEEAAIAEAIESLIAQDYPADRVEIVVLDGRSTDLTRAKVQEIARRERRVRLVDNPGLIVSTALNRGFLKARGAIVARADAHSRYAPDYLRAAVRALDESGADVVGGPMVAGACETPFQRAVGRALASRFGMGGAAFHRDAAAEDAAAGEDASGPAESVYLGVFRADALQRFGPFKEALVRDEDDEWFARARARGAAIHLDARIASTYRPRDCARRLFRQYFEYGLFKPAALKSVRGSMKLRQLAPSGLLLAVALAALGGPWLVVGASALVAYGGALLAASARAAALEEHEPRWWSVLRQASVFALMHLGYGLGFLAGLPRRAPDESRAAMRLVYAGYAADPRTRRRWSDRGRGQAALVKERDRALAARIGAHFGNRTRALTILDLGSGDRDLAAALRELGIAVEQVVAVDLLAERLAANPARARAAADGRLLPFRDESFDVVVQCTLLSSLPAEAARRLVAAEMVRVCRHGGLALSYDARLKNPFNRNVRRLSRREQRELFAGCEVAFEALTPLPPLVRRLPALAPWLARRKALCAFDLASIVRPPAPAPRGEIPFHRAALRESDVEAVAATLRSGWLTTGPRTRELEAELAKLCGRQHALCVSSATAALFLLYKGAGVAPGDEVLVPAMTFVATAEVAVHLGARPIFVDVDEETLLLDPDDLARKISPRAKLIAPVHYAGQPCAMGPILEVARAHRLAVVEDAAHCLTGRDGERRPGEGTLGAALSFYATKELPTGEGGAIVTDDESVVVRARRASLHGISRPAWTRMQVGARAVYDVEEIGWKMNLPDVLAALGLAQVGRMIVQRERREALARRYDERLRGLPGIRPLAVRSGCTSARHLYVVRVDATAAGLGRDELAAELGRFRVGTSVHFVPLPGMTVFRRLFGTRPDDCPRAARAGREVLSLPLYPDLTEAEVDEVAAAIRAIVEARAP